MTGTLTGEKLYDRQQQHQSPHQFGFSCMRAAAALELKGHLKIKKICPTSFSRYGLTRLVWESPVPAFYCSWREAKATRGQVGNMAGRREGERKRICMSISAPLALFSTELILSPNSCLFQLHSPAQVITHLPFFSLVP